jgi:predicted nuclease of restriction endonuclease-like (RecB) superfamily
MEGEAQNRIEIKSTNEFSEIVRLIEESKNRAFQKVNEELVLLYFNVGKTVSLRVSERVWGDKTVDELSAYILNRFPGLSGFTRRGLYRMKQFYETYSSDSDCFKLWLKIQAEKENSQFVSPVATQIKNTRENDNSIVSPLATQLQVSDNKHNKFVSTLLTQSTWSNHMEILSGGKTSEEKLYYLLLTAKDKLNKLELRRQIKTASFERTMLAKNQNKIVSSLPTQFPSGIFKDPYIFELRTN